MFLIIRVYTFKNKSFGIPRLCQVTLGGETRARLMKHAVSSNLLENLFRLQVSFWLIASSLEVFQFGQSEFQSSLDLTKVILSKAKFQTTVSSMFQMKQIAADAMISISNAHMRCHCY